MMTDVGLTPAQESAIAHIQKLSVECCKLRQANAELIVALRTSVACIKTAQQAITETTGRPWIGGAIDKHLNEVRAAIAKAEQQAAE